MLKAHRAYSETNQANHQLEDCLGELHPILRHKLLHLEDCLAKQQEHLQNQEVSLELVPHQLRQEVESLAGLQARQLVHLPNQKACLVVTLLVQVVVYSTRQAHQQPQAQGSHQRQALKVSLEQQEVFSAHNLSLLMAQIHLDFCHNQKSRNLQVPLQL